MGSRALGGYAAHDLQEFNDYIQLFWRSKPSLASQEWQKAKSSLPQHVRNICHSTGGCQIHMRLSCPCSMRILGGIRGVLITELNVPTEALGMEW